MATIAASEARQMFTSLLIDIYRERVRPTSFLRSFFPSVETITRYLTINVTRTDEKVAVDILRGADGHRNRFSLGTEKKFEPPLYNEYFDITSLDLYDRAFGTDQVDVSVFSQFMEEVAFKMEELIATIERAYELQCAQALETGVVTLVNTESIDYKRKAGSLIDGTSAPWTNDANSPFAQIASDIAFIRSVGKAQGGRYNVIMGSLAAEAFFANAKVLGRGPLTNVNFDSLRAPQRESTGGVSHGSVTAGDYSATIWTYPEVYKNAAGNMVPYLNPKKVITLPENPHFKMGFAAVPQLPSENGGKIQKGAFVFGKYVDERKKVVDYEVQSAGLAILTAVDQVVTRQAVQ